MNRGTARITERVLARASVDLGRAGLATLAVLMLAGVVDALLAPAPVPSRPGFVGTILASHGVVAAVRIAVVFGAAYLVLSVVVLARRGRWLTRVGPAETGDAIQTFDEKREIGAALAESTEEIQWLRTRLEAAEAFQHTLIAEIGSRGRHDSHG